jgi:uncharacterized protein involved in response to NO
MVIHNFNGGIETVLHLFKSASGKIIFVSAVLFGIVGCVIILRRMFAQKRWGGLCFVIIAPILLILSIMGPFVLMDSSLTYQVRTLSAAIGLMMFVAVIAVILGKAQRLKYEPHLRMESHERHDRPVELRRSNVASCRVG